MKRVWIAAMAAALVVSGTWLDGQAADEKALQIADGMRVTIPAADAYGLYDKAKIITVPKKNVPPEAKEGTMLRSASGQPAKVLEIKGDSVVIDTNHPLAGKDLTFDVNILKVEPPPKAAPEKKP